ncbi:hypothetical protein EJB05_57877 [Eragrostis curvula]|uniref:Protein kinase domain-containing protein n=1 Tax=Eragrostis curvula TaxID=38414 RepID=A0A5J9SCT1_9POAL|nr:hypothetical protein EJB05_57877 [Eragrostis curvula]
MDSTGVKDGGSVPCPVIHRVEGQVIITILDSNCKKMSRHKASMRYYVGEVKCDAGIVQSEGIKSTILCFEGDVAKNIHDCLKRISHPNVMKCLGLGSGIGGHSKYKFLSLPFFDTTFEEYLEDKKQCVQMERFTEELISLINDIVKALVALHNAGFCCRDLKARDIAILKQHNSKTAQIWNFQKCTSEDEKDLDWQRLCKLLKLTNLWSDEAEDLYKNILGGSLKGLDILRHCALLTVRKKFDNVLIFYFYTEVYWPKDGTQGIVGAPAWLDDVFYWKSERAWLQTASLSNPPDTYRGFAKSLRHVVEHEVDFLTPELSDRITFEDRELGRKEIDLECQIRIGSQSECIQPIPLLLSTSYRPCHAVHLRSSAPITIINASLRFPIMYCSKVKCP